MCLKLGLCWLRRQCCCAVAKLLPLHPLPAPPSLALPCSALLCPAPPYSALPGSASQTRLGNNIVKKNKIHNLNSPKEYNFLFERLFNAILRLVPSVMPCPKSRFLASLNISEQDSKRLFFFFKLRRITNFRAVSSQKMIFFLFVCVRSLLLCSLAVWQCLL